MERGGLVLLCCGLNLPHSLCRDGCQWANADFWLIMLISHLLQKLGIIATASNGNFHITSIADCNFAERLAKLIFDEKNPCHSYWWGLLKDQMLCWQDCVHNLKTILSNRFRSGSSRIKRTVMLQWVFLFFFSSSWFELVSAQFCPGLKGIPTGWWNLGSGRTGSCFLCKLLLVSGRTMAEVINSMNLQYELLIHPSVWYQFYYKLIFIL